MTSGSLDNLKLTPAGKAFFKGAIDNYFESDEYKAIRRHMDEQTRAQFGLRQLWEYPNPNPMPHLEWWPWLDKPRNLRREAGVRIRNAWAALRHGARLDMESY